MSKSPVPFAPETLESIQRAFRLATDLRHDTVGLEHLLLATIDDVNISNAARSSQEIASRMLQSIAVTSEKPKGECDL